MHITLNYQSIMIYAIQIKINWYYFYKYKIDMLHIHVKYVGQ